MVDTIAVKWLRNMLVERDFFYPNKAPHVLLLLLRSGIRGWVVENKSAHFIYLQGEYDARLRKRSCPWSLWLRGD